MDILDTYTKMSLVEKKKLLQDLKAHTEKEAVSRFRLKPGNDPIYKQEIARIDAELARENGQ